MINICNVFRGDTINTVLDIDLKLNAENIKDFIRGYVTRLKKDGAVVGLSGRLAYCGIKRRVRSAIKNL